MDATEWDARYDATELVWGREPNRFVAAELADLAPGRALDVACGEGRNAIWLATRGWETVGVDFSATAIDRARRLADQAGVAESTRFVVGDVVAGELPDAPFDVVLIAYLQLAADERRSALQHAARRVAIGGHLLVVAHDVTNLTDGVGGPQDPTVLFTSADVVSDIGNAFRVVKAGRVLRPVTTAEGERSAVDALVVARRNDG